MKLTLFLVASFGAVGAVARHVVGIWTARVFGEAFPVGTLLVNVVGCALLGMVYQYGISVPNFSEPWRVGLAAGFLGGLTTFSTFGLDTVRCLESSRWAVAFANVGLNLAFGFLAAWIGLWTVRWLTGAD